MNRLPQKAYNFNLSSEFKTNSVLVSILDTITDGIVIVSKENYKILYVNKAYESILGVKREKIIGRKLSEIEPETPLLEVLDKGVYLNNEKTILKSIGAYILANSSPIKLNGKIVGAISIFKNMKDVVELNQALKRTQTYANYLEEEISKARSGETGEDNFHGIVGQSRILRNTVDLIKQVAKYDYTVLLQGESGVGKELFASAIHYESNRSKGPFIKVNCPSIPETLIESELFGYAEGAFTGANRCGKIGKFEIADGGTIFLDEIGELDIKIQSKLLRVLQEKEFERIGSNSTKRVDVRVIAATNRNLKEMVERGKFREDLFYRLNVIPVKIPPLRERKDDIPLLVKEYIKRLEAKNNKKYFLDEEVMEIFYIHSWPGNVRELLSVLEFASVTAKEGQITIKHLPNYLLDFSKRRAHLNINNLKLKKIVAETEERAIREALSVAKQNKSKAIEILGISRRAFYQKLKQYNITE